MNDSDLEGTFCLSLKCIAKAATNIATAASYIPGPVGIVASAIAVAGNLVQGHYASAAIAASGLVGAGFIGKAAARTITSTKVLTKVMNAQAKMPLIGVNSRLFGYAAHGTHSFGNKTLPRIAQGLRVGWAQGATKGSVVWREAFQSHKIVFTITHKLRYFR